MGVELGMRASKNGKVSRRIYPGWRVVFGSWVGEVLSAFPVIGFTFSIFFAEIITSYGWSRSAASAYSVFLLCAGLTLPLWGISVDRYGVRQSITAAVLLFGITMSSFNWLSTLTHWYVGFVLLGIASGGISTLPYFRAISAWFDRRRGLALGIVMAGGGISAICMPVLVQYLIELIGWRGAFVSVAGLVIIVTLPVIWIFLLENPAAAGVRMEAWGETSEDKLSGVGASMQGNMSARDALRSADFWLMTTGMSIAMLSLMGALAHLVPILHDWGFSQREAAIGMSFLGAGSMAGRVVTGWLLDHLFASHVTALLFVMVGAGFLFIGLADHELWAMALCALVIGLAIGGEGDILAYMTSRYFGIASFGQIYGYAYTGLIVGGAAGPALVGWALASNIGSPQGVLAALGLVVIIAIIPVMRMSDYRVVAR